jgi:hypothetical protein
MRERARAFVKNAAHINNNQSLLLLLLLQHRDYSAIFAATDMKNASKAKLKVLSLN